MKFATLGLSTSPVGVTNISPHGFWLLLGEEELFFPFAEFPWFRNAKIDQLFNVELPSENHLYWLELDVDVSVESIRDPSKFPLMSQV